MSEQQTPPAAGGKASLKDALLGVYSLGVVAFTLIAHGESSWWTSIGYGLIWPIFIPDWYIDLRNKYLHG